MKDDEFSDKGDQLKTPEDKSSDSVKIINEYTKKGRMVLAIFMFIFMLSIPLYFFWTSEKLDIIAISEWSGSATQHKPEDSSDANDTTVGIYNVNGSVYYNNEAISNVTVKVVAKKARRPVQYAVGTTDDLGAFDVNIPSTKLGVTRFTVSATASRNLSSGYRPRQGETTISTDVDPVGQFTELNAWGLSIGIIFLVGILNGLLVKPMWPKISYYAAIFLAIAISTTMLWYIGCSLGIIGFEGQEEILQMGFCTLFKGTYVLGGPKEWILSMTSAENVGSNLENAASSTFGAPLWVVFLSVIGSAVFTMYYIIKEVGNPVSFADQKDLCERIHNLVQLQFFILFSPIAGIFVYQALVVAGAALQPLTVAIAALGAGLTLNSLLSSAVASSARWFSKQAAQTRDQLVSQTKSNTDKVEQLTS